MHHVAVMPDVHLGKGATVGSVVAMRDAVAPAAVGVDIGCGMAAVETNLRAEDLPDDLRAVRTEIERTIPVECRRTTSRSGAAAPEIAGAAAHVDEAVPRPRPALSRGWRIEPPVSSARWAAEITSSRSVSTPVGAVWLMLHSGSRHIGNALAQHHMQIARKLGHNEALEDRDLAVFLAGTPESRPTDVTSSGRRSTPAATAS